MNKIETVVIFFKIYFSQKKILTDSTCRCFLMVVILLVVVQGSVFAPLVYTLF
ncbi:MAG TPA: hypothetical protein PLY95_00730 [Candidatus Paceibacterota bacterium]|nr:hypothetical protein [Candidatus Paceibacterota bacterium]